MIQMIMLVFGLAGAALFIHLYSIGKTRTDGNKLPFLFFPGVPKLADIRISDSPCPEDVYLNCEEPSEADFNDSGRG